MISELYELEMREARRERNRWRLDRRTRGLKNVCVFPVDEGERRAILDTCERRKGRKVGSADPLEPGA